MNFETTCGWSDAKSDRDYDLKTAGTRFELINLNFDQKYQIQVV